MWAETTPQSIFPNRKIGALSDGAEASLLALEGNPLEDLSQRTLGEIPSQDTNRGARRMPPAAHKVLIARPRRPSIANGGHSVGLFSVVTAMVYPAWAVFIGDSAGFFPPEIQLTR
jgi:hypothetical protein